MDEAEKIDIAHARYRAVHGGKVLAVMGVAGGIYTGY